MRNRWSNVTLAAVERFVEVFPLEPLVTVVLSPAVPEILVLIGTRLLVGRLLTLVLMVILVEPTLLLVFVPTLMGLAPVLPLLRLRELVLVFRLLVLGFRALELSRRVFVLMMEVVVELSRGDGGGSAVCARALETRIATFSNQMAVNFIIMYTDLLGGCLRAAKCNTAEYCAAIEPSECELTSLNLVQQYYSGVNTPGALGMDDEGGESAGRACGWRGLRYSMAEI